MFIYYFFVTFRYSDFSSAKQAVRLCQPYLLIASTTIVHVDCLTEEWLGRLQFPMEVLNAEKQSIPSFSFEKNAWNAMASSDSLRSVEMWEFDFLCDGNVVYICISIYLSLCRVVLCCF